MLDFWEERQKGDFMSTNKKKWEYKIKVLEVHSHPILALGRWQIEGDDKKIIKEFPNVEKYINQLGEEGWELVGTAPGSDSQGTITKVLLIFKREKE
uniref:DUF4177 domain-containing protein n=1 Tax=candidate division WOR-3 bacterium TaxID=2052148 RepID=A0A7V4CII0_UNCW3